MEDGSRQFLFHKSTMSDDYFESRTDRLALDRKITLSEKDSYNTKNNKSQQQQQPGRLSVIPSMAHHKVELEIPLQKRHYNIDETIKEEDDNKWSLLSLQKRSRLSVYSTFPIYKHIINSTSRNEIICNLYAMSVLRGRVGYTTGTANIKFNNTIAITKNTTQSTSLNVGIGKSPTITSTSIDDILSSNVISYIPSINIGVEKTIRDSSDNTTQSIITSIYFPKHTDISQFKLSINTLTQNGQQQRILLHRLLGWYNYHCPTLSFRTETSINNPFFVSSINNIIRSITLSISPATTILSNNNDKNKNNKNLIMTNNSNNNNSQKWKIWRIRFGFNKFEKYYYPLLSSFISFTLPKTTKTSDKKIDFSFSWIISKSLHLGGMWVHKILSSTAPTKVVRELAIGVTLDSKTTNKSGSSSILDLRNITWILSWTEGDFTLRIPILMSSVISATSLVYYQIFQFFYLSFISGIIQEVISHALFVRAIKDKIDDNRINNEQQQDRGITKFQRAKEIAIIQQSFMERQAKIRMDNEKERNGLIINKAIYYLSKNGSTFNDDSSIAFDVTIPMQFWVSSNESRLELFGKRSGMLGFFDLATTIPNDEDSNDINNKANQSKSDIVERGWFLFQRFSSIWKNGDSDDSSNTQSTTNAHGEVNYYVPKLYMTYQFAGISYEIIIDDDEEISIPDPHRARRIY